VTFSEDVYNPPGDSGAEDVTNRDNYLLVEQGANKVFDTISCLGGRLADDVQVTVNGVTYSNSGGVFVATVSINSGAPLSPGQYRLHVCGTTSVVDLSGNPINGGLDYMRDFAVGRGGSLPATGFAPDRVTVLPPQPSTQAYADSPLQLEIPKLGLSMAIVGVPLVDGDWDVSWLGNRAGWLQGTTFPTWAGNSVITGHVWDAYNRPGPFAGLNRLWWGDQIIIRGWGQQYIFEVRSVQVIGPSDTSLAFKHEEYNWLTLITCRGYESDSGTYRNRLIVRAVLVKIK
jgi:LPXTG-site transpeptidase (sortase) family protein